MDMKLSENIRKYRKERSLTQEQLAEVLGVTTGAVYKWEAGLSVPELNMIVELADFFDTSVDALLGYVMKDNGLGKTLERLDEFLNSRDKAGISEVEKALKRYPNSFEVVYKSAMLLYMIGNDCKDKKLLMKSLELFKNSRTLISQNIYERISEATISGNMAMVYIAMDESKKAAEIMKANNAGGIYDAMIGLCLLRCGSSDEAEVYVSNSFYNGMSGIINFMYIYTLLNIRKGKFDLAEDMLSWGKSFMQGLVVSDEISYFDRVTATVMMLGGYVKLRQGDLSLAKQELKAAAETAGRFDSAPCYRVRGLRFMTQPTESYDILGKTAAEGLEYILKEINDPVFDKLWKEVAEK